MAYVFSFLCFCYFFLTAAGLCAVLGLLYPLVIIFDRRRKLLHYLSITWGFHFVRLNPLWKCHFEGRDNLPPGERCVIVANHQSLADVFVLSGLRHHFRWVAKDSLMRIPAFGWIMRLNGDVPIKRGDRKSIREMMSACKQWLNQGVSLLMFPEGTRSENGQIGEFRDGPFRLAVDCGVPVLPVVITGTRDILAKHSKTFNFSGRMTVKILPPVLPSAFEGGSGQMRAYVRELMKGTLESMLRQSCDLPLQAAPVPIQQAPEGIDNCHIRR